MFLSSVNDTTVFVAVGQKPGINFSSPFWVPAPPHPIPSNPSSIPVNFFDKIFLEYFNLLCSSPSTTPQPKCNQHSASLTCDRCSLVFSSCSPSNPLFVPKWEGSFKHQIECQAIMHPCPYFHFKGNSWFSHGFGGFSSLIMMRKIPLIMATRPAWSGSCPPLGCDSLQVCPHLLHPATWTVLSLATGSLYLLFRLSRRLPLPLYLREAFLNPHDLITYLSCTSS